MCMSLSNVQSTLQKEEGYIPDKSLTAHISMPIKKLT